MREKYLKFAQKKLRESNMLINLVRQRVKELKCNNPEEIVFREIIEGVIRYEL